MFYFKFQEKQALEFFINIILWFTREVFSFFLLVIQKEEGI